MRKKSDSGTVEFKTMQFRELTELRFRRVKQVAVVIQLLSSKPFCGGSQVLFSAANDLR
jgi:hypothetical protein